MIFINDDYLNKENTNISNFNKKQSNNFISKPTKVDFNKTNKKFCQDDENKDISVSYKKNYFKIFISHSLQGIYFLLKIIFFILLFIIITNTYKAIQIKNKNNIEVVTESLSQETTENIINNNINKEINNTFLQTTTNYIIKLNEILEGEKACIQNLKEKIITEKECYNYFNKSLERKNEILQKYLKEDFENTDYNNLIVNKTKQTYLNSINLSKSIINRYLSSENYLKMISDMEVFLPKHQEYIKELQDLLK